MIDEAHLFQSLHLIERERYLGLIKPELHEMMTIIQTLSRADVQDCRALPCLLVKAPALIALARG